MAPLGSFFSLAQRLTGIFCRPDDAGDVKIALMADQREKPCPDRYLSFSRSCVSCPACPSPPSPPLIEPAFAGNVDPRQRHRRVEFRVRAEKFSLSCACTAVTFNDNIATVIRGYKRFACVTTGNDRYVRKLKKKLEQAFCIKMCKISESYYFQYLISSI